MATNVKSDIPSSPPNDESDLDPAPEEEEDPVDEPDGEPLEDQKPPPLGNNYNDILKRLQSTGALIKKPKQELRCFTCDKDFREWDELEKHLIQHVSLPSVVVDKLPSDEEDAALSGDDWSDEDEDATSAAPQTTPQKTPQKIDISQIMKNPGLSIKKPGLTDSKPASSESALSKLSGLGFTIKKNTTPIKQENAETEKQGSSDIMQKLGQLGGIKLKLKSDGANSKSFKVINGLRDFKASDDEDEENNEAEKEDRTGDGDSGDEGEKDSNDREDSGDEQPAEDDDEDEEIPLATRKINNAIKNAIKKKTEQPEQVKTEMPEVEKAPVNSAPIKKGPGRPAVKQTPRRGANHPLAAKQQQPTQGKDISTTFSTPERRESQETTLENVVVKKEIEAGVNETPSSTIPIFSGQVKTERTSPPPSDTNISTPIISNVKTEIDTTGNVPKQEPLFQTSGLSSTATAPLLSVTKKEDSMTIIEINGDSDGDDDCCVVSATPAPDIKPIIPKPENLPTSYPPAAFASTQSSFASAPVLSSRLSAPSTEKQHSFNWNAPDSKPPLDMLEKSTDELFDSLMSAKRDNSMICSDAEYISLDTLGPQHSCEVCSTRFTSLTALDDHRRMTGHSSSLVAPSSSTLLPYNPTIQSNLLSSLLPVKQLADQVGKIAVMGSGPGFTHQQNVMINIQAYPGAGGGVMGPPPPPYNSYAPNQGMHPGFQQTPTSMYNQGMPGQQMSGQYPGQNFMGQYQPAMSKSGYSIPTSSPYSTSSPLQGMQQAVYGQSGMMGNQMGQMGPPASSYVPVSSPSGMMKPPTSSGVRIQNVQTFAPGQFGATGQQMTSAEMGGPGQPTMPGQTVGGQMPAPGPIRMAAGANVTGTRPRMPNVRGVRPTIRPGIQVHGQVRGAKPRMPMKRPAGGPGVNTPLKRRNDMLLPGKHDNEDCQVMSMQKQRDGLPMIQSVQGAKDKLNLGSQISITKKPAPNKQANAMANVLASRGISIKQKPKSRSPSPERPIPHIPNLGSGVSIKHTSKSSNFSIPEAKVGGGMNSCRYCNKSFMNSNSLAQHVATVHPSKLNAFKCDECPASYPRSLQLQHHKRVFHNVQGPNRELGLPVVDMSQEDNIKRLSNLGIYSFIPLANREQAGGCFGIPVISVHNMHNGLTNGLQALGADGLLSLGPMKPLPNT